MGPVARLFFQSPLYIVTTHSGQFVNRFRDTRKPQIHSHAASWTASDTPYSQILRQSPQNKVKRLRASDIGLHEPPKSGITHEIASGINPGINPIEGLEVIDIHCHILPGLDDGAEDWEQKSGDGANCRPLTVSRGSYAPPIFPHDVSRKQPDRNPGRHLKNCERGSGKQKSRLELYPGCELAIDSNLPEKIESGELLTINDNRRIALVEMPGEVIPPNLDRFFWMMLVRGGVALFWRTPKETIH